MTTRNLKQEVQDTLSKLRTLRDEIRVRIHLGGMDLKDKWAEPEPLLFAEFGSLAEEVVAVRTTVPGVDCALMPTLSAAVPFAAMVGPVQVAVLAENEQT